MLTKQEMFTRAVVGLRSQGWIPARGQGGCWYSYDAGDGLGERRCAWGWVDRSLTRGDIGTVRSLRADGLGLAADLDTETLEFAEKLQGTHDKSVSSNLEENMRLFGLKYQLEWPSEELTP